VIDTIDMFDTPRKDAAAWADGVLVDALADAKTRLKVIRADEELELQVLDAIVVVAEAKALRYADNHAGQVRAADAAPALLGWVNRDRRLAQALHVLACVSVSAGDIPMLPKEYL
jgi:hypothetical protein